MKWIIAAMLLLSSCGPSQIVKGASDLFIYKDESNGVTCYRLSTTSGLSCIQTNNIGK